jgi:hypothetical protein
VLAFCRGTALDTRAGVTSTDIRVLPYQAAIAAPADLLARKVEEPCRSSCCFRHLGRRASVHTAQREELVVLAIRSLREQKLGLSNARALRLLSSEMPHSGPQSSLEPHRSAKPGRSVNDCPFRARIGFATFQNERAPRSRQALPSRGNRHIGVCDPESGKECFPCASQLLIWEASSPQKSSKLLK